MSLYARLAALVLILGAAAALWWKADRMLANADRTGYERRSAEVTAGELERARGNAATTLRRLEVQGENHETAAAQLTAANAAAAAARDAGDRLRDRTNQLIEQFCATAGDPAAIARCKTADAPAGVLADVQRSLVSRAELLARVADQRFVAGNACTADYEALGR